MENDVQSKDKEGKPPVSKINIPSIICTTCDIQGNVTFGKGEKLYF
jgi:hypothetical protein